MANKNQQPYIIFDLGNVCVEIHPHRTIAGLAAICDISEAALRPFFLSPLHNRFMRGSLSAEAFYSAFCLTYRCEPGFEQFCAVWNRIIGEEKAGLSELVARLKARYPLGLLSNTDPLHWMLAKQRCPALAHFTHIFLSFEMGQIKPEPEIFRTMLLRLAAPPSAVYFFDDSQENVAAAAKLGINAFQVTTPAEIHLILETQQILP
jgi:putative hydrolase of the HAD superfamily